MHSSNRLLSAVALAFLVACSHASNDSGEATNTSATSAATAAATDAAPNDAGSGGTTVTTSQGKVTIGASIDPSALGVPVYPGMSQASNASYQASSSNGDAVAAYKSDDAFDKVYAFYKGQLPSNAEQMKTPDMAMFTTQVGDATINVEVLSKSGQPGTEILITRSKSK